ncbi:MAG: VOC family protein [Candidatus Poseidoniales archaeon]
MRNPNDVCHIAVPCKDLESTVDFYCNKLGCELARTKSDRVTFNFFGDQLVCHLSPKNVPLEVKPYPYHFGVTFSSLSDFDSIREKLLSNGVKLLQDSNRFEGKPDEHKTFFISDPSNNVVEFKYYFNDKMKY